MELTHQFTVPVEVEEAWAHFQDIASVAECFPGAVVTDVADETFHGSVKVKLGPIALVYNGQGTFTEKDESAHRFVVDAKGKDKRGNGTAGATVTLEMSPSGEATDVKVHTDLAITGKPAQFGRGVMQDVSDKLLGQFVACLEQRMGEGPVEPAAEAAAAPAPAAEPAAPATAPAPPAPAAPVTPPTGAAAAGTTPAAAPPPRHAATPPAAAGGGAAASRAAAAPSAARPTDDALDLGATVLPVLVKSYWKQALGAAAVVALIVWIIKR